MQAWGKRLYLGLCRVAPWLQSSAVRGGPLPTARNSGGVVNGFLVAQPWQTSRRPEEAPERSSRARSK